jgi:hypothetical protein
VSAARQQASVRAHAHVRTRATRTHPRNGALYVRHEARVRHVRRARGRHCCRDDGQARRVAQRRGDGLVRQAQQRLEEEAHEQAGRQVQLGREGESVGAASVALRVRARAAPVPAVRGAHAPRRLLRVDAHQRVQRQPARAVQAARA